MRSVNIFYLIVIMLAVIFSCKRETDNVAGNPDEISFDVNGFIFGDNIINSKSASVLLAKLETEKITENFDDFGWELSVETDNQQSESPIFTKKSLSVGNKVASTITMASGIKYRLLIYEVVGSNEVIRYNREVTSGVDRHKVTLERNKNYKWYAYSYNNTEAIPSPSNVNDPVIPSTTNSPLLAANGAVATGGANDSEKDVNIVFKALNNHIALEINAVQMFALSIQEISATVTGSPLTTHNYSLKSEAKVGSSQSSTSINRAINYTVNNGPTAQTLAAIKRSSNNLYTSTDNPSLSITINRLVLSVQSETLTPMTKTLIASAAQAKTISFSSALFNEATKKRKVAKITLFSGGNGGDFLLGNGNLCYDATKAYPYYFLPSNTIGDIALPCQCYFFFNTLESAYYADNDEVIFPVRRTPGDPCSKVLPEGEWVTPSVEDYEDILINYEATNNYDPIIGDRPTVVIFDINGSDVYFPDVGTANTDCDIGNLNDSHYWTRDEYSSTRGYVLETGGYGGSNTTYKAAIEHQTKDGRARSVRCIKRM